MKRKASALEEHTMCDWSPSDNDSYTSSASTVSPDSVKHFSPGNHFQQFWNVSAVPYQNSRTRKRMRDGRPDEEIVHQATLAKLFNAQRHLDPRLSDDDLSVTQMTTSKPEAKQRTLEAFFGGANSRTRFTSGQHQSNLEARVSTLQCDGCSSRLPNDSFTTPMGTVEPGSDSEWSCAYCGKQVCDMCAVRGDLRVCLECAVPGGGTQPEDKMCMDWR